MNMHLKTTVRDCLIFNKKFYYFNIIFNINTGNKMSSKEKQVQKHIGQINKASYCRSCLYGPLGWK